MKKSPRKQNRRSKPEASAGSATAPSRKRQILKRSKSKAAVAEDPKEDEARESVEEAPRKRRGRRENADGSDESKSKAKPGAKAKSKAKKPAKKEKKKAEPRPRGRQARVQTAADRLLDSPHRSDPVIKALMDFAIQFGPEWDHPDKFDEFKVQLKKSCTEGLKQAKLNCYWTRNGCGVKPSATEADLHNFSWNSSRAPSRWKLAVAIRAGGLAVSKIVFCKSLC